MSAMKLEKIFDAFPPPKFLDMPFTGVSISDSAIRAIRLGRKSGKLYIEKHGEKTLSPGIVTNGQIENVEEVVKALSSLKKDMNMDYVKLSLPEEKAYLFTAKIPMVKKEEVRSAIESKMEENVPVSPGDLVFDYKMLESSHQEHIEVAVSALPIPLVDLYVEIAGKAGLSLLSLEIESQAATRALLPHGDLSTTLIVHVGLEKVGLYVAHSRVVHFTSTVSTKGDPAGNPSSLLQEIKKLYVYWHTLKENVDKPEKKISSIVICGEKFDESILTFLSGNIDTKVIKGNVWTNVLDVNAEVPDISFSDSLKYAVAVGLALPSEILI